MAYAGIWPATNNLPEYYCLFPYIVLIRLQHITTGSGSHVPSYNTGNTPPTATPSALNYTIPIKLRLHFDNIRSDAGSDALTYSWEEYDLGASGNWNAPVDALFSVCSGDKWFPHIS
jgi:hypothetical protein